jgi:hypothetical protein
MRKTAPFGRGSESALAVESAIAVGSLRTIDTALAVESARGVGAVLRIAGVDETALEFLGHAGDFL